MAADFTSPSSPSSRSHTPSSSPSPASPALGAQSLASSPLDPYDAPPSWVQRNGAYLWAAGVFVLTVVLTVLAFPPSKTPAFAYAFAAPALFWAYRRPSFRLFTVTVLAAQGVAWTIILGWLHNVTIGGLLLLGPFIGAWIGSWFLAAHWTMPRLLGRPTMLRLLAMFGLAGLWVVLEWTRTWFLSGFPWMPLAATQWQQVAILQIAAFTGAGGVSFVLISMNLGFAAYAHRLICEGRTGLNRRSQEFFAALFLLVVCVATQIQETFNRHNYTIALGKFAFVQPYIPQEIKWDDTKGPGILNVLATLTHEAAATKPDVIFWPEATTPWAVKGDAEMQNWVQSLVKDINTPLVLGSIAREVSPEFPTDPKKDKWFNGVFVVEPATGVHEHFYAKRKLVPFGEFVPLRPLLGWLGKFVPIGDDFQHGADASPLPLAINGRELKIGALLCYEDIFPALSRESVKAGADLLVVYTNNGWFGEGGAAYQHASNAVLRAVETRRPLLRCGNGGWSGWIDEFGAIRAVLTKDHNGRVTTDSTLAAEGSVYFRGTQSVKVTADARWLGKESFYVQHGDWFVVACAILAALGWGMLRIQPPLVTAPVKRSRFSNTADWDADSDEDDDDRSGNGRGRGDLTPLGR